MLKKMFEPQPTLLVEVDGGRPHVVKLCARSCCKEPLRPGETYFNRSTHGYYCEACAVLLNRANEREAMELYGGPLCVSEVVK